MNQKNKKTVNAWNTRENHSCKEVDRSSRKEIGHTLHGTQCSKSERTTQDTIKTDIATVQ